MSKIGIPAHISYRSGRMARISRMLLDGKLLFDCEEEEVRAEEWAEDERVLFEGWASDRGLAMRLMDAIDSEHSLGFPIPWEVPVITGDEPDEEDMMV